MGLFKKKEPKNTGDINSFIGNNNKISNGNMFEMYQEAEIKNQKLNLEWSSDGPYSESIGDDVDRAIYGWVKNTTPQPYFQYYTLCNYFTNLFVYYTDDLELMQAIKQAQVIAFFNGKSGLWINKTVNKVIPVAIVEYDQDNYGTIKRVKINTHYNWSDPNKSYALDHKYDLWINIGDIIPYTFKHNGMSCFVWCREYVTVQNRLLNQIGVCSLISNKIVSFTMESKNDNKKSLLSFLNPTRFFIYSRQNSRFADSVKILTELIGSDLTPRYLDIYRQTMDIYSDYLGIRNNTEFKKERNTVDEVNAEQGWFNALEQELYFNFMMFMEKINKHPAINTIVTYQDFTRSNQDVEEEQLDDTQASDNPTRL